MTYGKPLDMQNKEGLEKKKYQNQIPLTPNFDQFFQVHESFSIYGNYCFRWDQRL